MTAWAGGALDTPYKGPLSFEPEDAPYFFGREQEADLLLAKVLSSRLTLVHAQSGAGKTSLLNAKVIPDLELHGATSFRILLRGNPTQAVRHSVLLSLLPAPAAELVAVDRTLRLFASDGEDLAVGEILERVDAHRSGAAAEVRRALLAIDTAVAIKPAGVDLSGSVRPLFLRLLRETLEISQYSEHLQATIPGIPAITEQTRVSELRLILGDPASAAAHERLLADLYVPSPSLLDFFGNLVEQYGKRRTQFSLVLVLDQFEELFTLYTDSPQSPGKWHLRWEFIERFEELYEAGTALPIRYVISMRDDYIAHLDPVRRFARDLDASSFHLSLLEKQNARLAIEKPARLWGYVFSEECYGDILVTLTREDRFIEPTPLQIVCERLWRDRQQARDVGPEGLRLISAAAFPPGGTVAILDSFFAEVIRSMPDAADRAEALDILEPLVTPAGTRNIVSLDSLVVVPFRDVQQRGRLVELLVTTRILRVEERLGGKFVEISHEFLIAPVLSTLRSALNDDPAHNQFRSTLRALERFREMDFRSDSSRLASRQLLQAALEYSDLIIWDRDDWAIEMLFRSAVVNNAGRAAVHHWGELYARTATAQAAPSLDDRWFQERAVALLSVSEMDAVNRDHTATWSPIHLELVLRSHLRRGGDRHRDQIVHWTRELNLAWQRELRSRS